VSERIDRRADFSSIRYAQVWEDADVLLAALDIQPADACLSIASAGDNVLAMLTRDPGRIIAVDLSPAQLACLGLRMAAYRALTHEELLQLVGSRACADRWALYRHCRARGGLCVEHAAFWDARRPQIEQGIGHAGKFERYFNLFRTRILPLVHRQETVRELLEPRTQDERECFYAQRWNNRRWRWLFRLFFSRRLMGWLGRDPEFFRYVEGSVADRILQRAQYAMTTLDPTDNPYMQWILLGRHQAALPLALREEHFQTIRDRLDRVELLCASIGDVLADMPDASVDRFNLSDIFEYLSDADSHAIFEACARVGRPGARLAYWNMLVPRQRPEALAARLRPLLDLADALHADDKAFFYQRLRIDEVRP
jgi:S-adenosylmethionine-diacylglycerol 3-amino-3-carboxypropyl transferase